MNARIRLAFIFTALVGAAVGQAQEIPAQFQAVSKIVGKPGALNADGSYRINIARNDVKFTNSNGMAIPADLGLSTYIALSGNADKVLAVGDMAMLEFEINPVIDALEAGGFEIVALHNHMTTEEPRLFYMHYEVIGKPEDIANTFRTALDILGKPVESAGTPSGTKPKLDADALATVFGSKPQVFPSGVLRFANPRKDFKVTVDGESFTPGMGIGSWAAFNACDCGLTMVMGDTCCVRTDLQQVIKELRKVGIHITAIHNHVLGASQEVEFLHYDGEGDSLKMAAGIKACWNALGVK